VKKLLLGVLVSALFVYLSFRGVEWSRVFEGMKRVEIGYALLALILSFLVTFLRSLRWAIVLSPIEKIGQRKLFPITCVGYMAITLVPMRLGELLRPYLVSAKSGIPMGSAMATIVLERVLDILTILGLLFFILIVSTPPPWLVKTGIGVLPFFLFSVVMVCLLHFRKELAFALLEPLLKRLPVHLREKIEGMLEGFVEGFQIIGNGKRLLSTVFLSLLIWICSGVAVYSLFHFQRLNLPIMTAFVVLVVLIVGISLPTAPAMIGNFQYACIVALAFFGIPKADAFVFAMVNYVLGIGMTILLGLVFLPSVEVSFKDILGRFRTQDQK
jgi:uncharacterized protein (TIRG00374 family)